MIKDQIGLQEVIAFLNHMLEIDPQATRDLIETRVPCNAEMADHPTIQVQAYPGEAFQLGVLGLINGIFGVDEEGWGPIAACFEVICPEHGKIEGPGIVGDTCTSNVSHPLEGLGPTALRPRTCGRTLVLGKLTHFRETKERDGHTLL